MNELISFLLLQDKSEFIKIRIKKLVESGMVPALVCLANTDAAILTDTTKELLARCILMFSNCNMYLWYDEIAEVH